LLEAVVRYEVVGTIVAWPSPVPPGAVYCANHHLGGVEAYIAAEQEAVRFYALWNMGHQWDISLMYRRKSER
jgi:hypothetical protein